jgi:hypothetical protein
MKTAKSVRILVLLLALAVVAACHPKPNIRPELVQGPGWTAENNNLHQIDGPPPGDPPGAFRVYRSGMPTAETYAKWCKDYGIERSIVLAGDAGTHELAYSKQGTCPDFKVLYNETQSPSVPLTAEFLKFFDDEIARAKADHVGILLRCQTGSHRAGRLAAYYQMKYQGLSADEAIAVMDYNGTMMPLFDPVLRPQVRALDDYIHGRPCSQPAKYCVRENK